MATIDLGKVAFVWKGTYNSGTTYEEKDVVQYTDSGELSSYIYVNASSASGQTPSTGGTVNTTYWSKMAGGTSLSVGNNKVVTTDSSGNVSSVALGSAGQALKVNSGATGFEFGDTGGGLQSIQTFTANGTYTKPSGINRLKVIVTGGGGGGGGGENNWNSMSAGGAGGTAIKVIDATSITTETVTVGAGGSGASGGSSGTTGGAGGTSSFGSHCSATGGHAGLGNNNPASYTSGVGSGGDINITGGHAQGFQGGDGTTDQAGGSIGGASYWGGGGMAGANGGQYAGGAGQAYGSGGGAGDHDGGSTYGGGGAGKAGIVYIEEYK